MKIKKLLFYLRKNIIILITLFAYISFFYAFLQNNILFSILFILIFFVSLHYFLIELKDYGLQYFVLIIVGATFLEMFLVGFDNLFKQFSLYVINISVIFLFVSIDSHINNSKRISSLNLFFSGARKFSFFLAIGYALLFLGKYDNFNLECEDLYKQLNNFIGFVSQPLNMSISEVEQIKAKIQEFYNTEVKDLFSIPEEVSLENKVPSLSGKNLLENGNISDIEDRQLRETLLRKSKEFSSGEGREGLTGGMNSLKTKLIDNVIEDKKKLDSKICDFLIEEIKSRYDNPSFKFSVVVFMFVLFRPFLRIVFFIISLINLIVFKVLNLLKVYRFQTVTDEVEEIV